MSEGADAGNGTVGLFAEDGSCTDKFYESVPELLGEHFYNDGAKRQEPTKLYDRDRIKNINDLLLRDVQAQRGLTKRLEGMVKVPGDGATPDEVSAFRKAKGVPDTAEGYELDIPDGDDKAGFEQIAAIVKKGAFQHGIGAKELKAVWPDVLAGLKAQNAAIEAAGKKLMDDEEAKLKGELGGKYDLFIKAGNDAIAKFKNGNEAMKVLQTFGLDRNPVIRKLMAEIAPLVLPASALPGGGSAEGGEGWFTNYDEVGKD